MVIAGCFLIGLTGSIGVFPFVSETPQGTGETVLLVATSVVLSGLIIAGIMSILKTRIDISHDAISISGLRKGKSFPLDSISGYRGGRDIFLCGHDGKVVMQLPGILESHHELRLWAMENYDDLAAIDFAKSRTDILNNPAFGKGETEVQNRLAKARSAANF